MQIGTAAVLLSAFLVSGCAPVPLKVQSPAGPRITAFRKLAVLPLRIDVVEVGASGMVEKMDDWSEQAVANVAAAVGIELARSGRFPIADFSTGGFPDALKSDLRETEALFDAVDGALRLHVYGSRAQRFEEQRAGFKHSLGAETARLRTADVDAFLLVRGVDRISSAARKAVMTSAVVAAAALRVPFVPEMGITAMSAALVDAATGDIFWYTFDATLGTHDLRDARSAASFVSRLFAQLPAP